MVTEQGTTRRTRLGTHLRGIRLPIVLAACALGGFTICGLAALTLGGCGRAATGQNPPTASPTATPFTWFTPEPLGGHPATVREKRMLAAAADFVKDPVFSGQRYIDRNDYHKYVGRPGEIVAYVVLLMQHGIEVSAVVDTASGEVRPVATIGGSDDPHFGVPPWTSGMIPSTSRTAFSKGETWAMGAAASWFDAQIVQKLGWPAAAKPSVGGYIVGWPSVGVLLIYVTEQNGKPAALPLGRYFPW